MNDLFIDLFTNHDLGISILDVPLIFLDNICYGING